MNWFGNLPVGLVAEHGFFIREAGEIEWKKQHEIEDWEWKKNIKPIFQYFTERTPGSFFEEKETSLTWHYRASELGSFRAQEMQSHLGSISILLFLPLLRKYYIPCGCNCWR
jgi:trehalose-phosphatase